ncbi:hypothetical protein LCGC14_2164370 [marine sediment metagenome]|uniref:Uncharacterized protein n=1 Tax=marine sediment metagenome TaxID=412755 RepID=A0A0F9GMY3_9ZZZZ
MTDKAREELEAFGWIVDYYPDRKNKWFVGLGSHGDSAPTLRKAIKRCLRCCKIGKTWPERRAQALEIMNKYLGGYK